MPAGGKFLDTASCSRYSDASTETVFRIKTTHPVGRSLSAPAYRRQFSKTAWAFERCSSIAFTISARKSSLFKDSSILSITTSVPTAVAIPTNGTAVRSPRAAKLSTPRAASRCPTRCAIIAVRTPEETLMPTLVSNSVIRGGAVKLGIGGKASKVASTRTSAGLVLTTRSRINSRSLS